jgi:deoxycytidylate deaminase
VEEFSIAPMSNTEHIQESPATLQVVPKRFAQLVDTAKALKGTQQSGPSFHVAFILKGRKPIVIGANSYIKRNRAAAAYRATKHNGPYIAGVHAEAKVLGKVKYAEHDNLALVIIRIDNNGRLANSCPCPNCSYMIGRTPSIKRVFYSTDKGEFVRFPATK